MLQKFSTQDPKQELGGPLANDLLSALGNVEVTRHDHRQMVSLGKSDTDNRTPHVGLDVHQVELIRTTPLAAVEPLSRAAGVSRESEFPR